MKEIFGKLKRENLRADEKSEILSALKIFVAQNPVQRAESPFYDFWFALGHRAIIAPVLVAVVLVFGGGAITAARNSLPGDALYPVKILNEKIETQIARGYKVTAKVNTDHAVSRLKEVEQIVASDKKLDKQVSQEIETKFDTQAGQAIENINKLKESGDDVAAEKLQTSFTSSLQEREKAIVNLLNETKPEEETRTELANVVSNIRYHLARAEGYRPSRPERPEAPNDGETGIMMFSTGAAEEASTTPKSDDAASEQAATSTATSTDLEIEEDASTNNQD